MDKFAKLKGVVSQPEIARRREQSKKDQLASKAAQPSSGRSSQTSRQRRDMRRRTAAQPYSGPRQPGYTQPTSAAYKGKGKGKGKGPTRPKSGGVAALRAADGPNLTSALAVMYRPSFSPVRSRIETVRFRATFNLSMSPTGAPPAYYPTIMFRPTHGNVHTLLIPGQSSTNIVPVAGFWTTFLSNNGTYGSGAGSNMPDWVDWRNSLGNATVDDGLVANSAASWVPGFFEALSKPLIGTYGVRARALGGIARIRITCGPTARGYLVVRKLNAVDVTLTPKELYAQMSGISGNTRHVLRPGTVSTHHFCAPIENPGVKNLWTGTGSQEVSWVGATYSPICFSFRDVAHSWTSDVAPLVEYTTLNTIQMELGDEYHHLSNVEKTRTLGEAAHTLAVERIAEGGVLGGGGALGAAGTMATRVETMMEGAAVDLSTMLEAGAIISL